MLPAATARTHLVQSQISCWRRFSGMRAKYHCSRRDMLGNGPCQLGHLLVAGNYAALPLTRRRQRPTTTPPGQTPSSQLEPAALRWRHSMLPALRGGTAGEMLILRFLIAPCKRSPARRRSWALVAVSKMTPRFKDRTFAQGCTSGNSRTIDHTHTAGSLISAERATTLNDALLLDLANSNLLIRRFHKHLLALCYQVRCRRHAEATLQAGGHLASPTAMTSAGAFNITCSPSTFCSAAFSRAVVTAERYH